MPKNNPKDFTQHSEHGESLKSTIISCSALNKPQQLKTMYPGPHGLNKIKKEEVTASLFQEISCCKSNFFTAAHMTFDYSSKDYCH
jgi:hypothetical protein